MGLYQELFYSEFTSNLLSDSQMVDYMIKVERSLLEAQETHKMIPAGTLDQFERILAEVEIDWNQLRQSVPRSGNAAAPLIKQLVAHSEKGYTQVGKYLHLGATSQDIIDTATVLKIKDFAHWLTENIKLLLEGLRTLALKNQHTFMVGRTLMQQAKPITFGFKVANWHKSVKYCLSQLEDSQTELLKIQLGGAVGSQNMYLTEEVRKSCAHLLGLQDAKPWHTQRATMVMYACKLGVLCGSLAKIARDIVLLSQTEVGEVQEPAADGRGTSSTMPHKRNPILSSAILANAHRTPFLVANILAALPQAHERDASLWHTEWETLDQIIALTAGAVEKSIELIQGLEVKPDRMRQNLKLTNGLIFAERVAQRLAKTLGKKQADQLMRQASKKSIESQRHLREIIEEMSLGIPPRELAALFDPQQAIGFDIEIVAELKE